LGVTLTAAADALSGRSPGDYVMGTGLVAVYLSLRYHALKPTYLPKRLAELSAAAAVQQYKLRVLLVQVRGGWRGALLTFTQLTDRVQQ
jgi:hypothetical protein